MLLEGAGLPIARCGICKRDVLTHVRLDRDGCLCRCCVDCDALFDPAEVRWIDEEAFRSGDAAGGAVEERGCGSGGCGSGACGRR